ncbi:hypothetical protein [Bifidobacterium olomucense]|uniref:Uncharacterized protein n=1 Tax=Bifidobacterium olomucense TaxID=2675324 RepID=A0A7Y0HX48_9BIFI|nr:hypothetical protein [Bifidobacterium sp. DSM 109959]NMM97594.1 hypothetical protein [Bifidobacterium sp. DSM 109959]
MPKYYDVTVELATGDIKCMLHDGYEYDESTSDLWFGEEDPTRDRRFHEAMAIALLTRLQHPECFEAERNETGAQATQDAPADDPFDGGRNLLVMVNGPRIPGEE